MNYSFFDFFICIIIFIFSCWISDNVEVEKDYIFPALVRFEAFIITYFSLFSVVFYIIYWVEVYFHG